MKTIISFTTIPSRINKIKPMVDSILNQSYKVDEIILWVSEDYKRDNHPLVIPDFIDNSIIKVNYCKDIGPFTKLYYSLKKYWGQKDTIIITADDDVFYPKNWVKNLIDYSNKKPNVVVGYRGRVLHNKLNYNHSKLYLGSKTPVNVDIITGTWGVLYKPRFFSDDIFNYNKINGSFFVDDIWINGNLAKNNTPRVVIENCGVKPIDNLMDVNSLWSLNKDGVNNNKMLKYFQGVI